MIALPNLLQVTAVAKLFRNQLQSISRDQYKSAFYATNLSKDMTISMKSEVINQISKQLTAITLTTTLAAVPRPTMESSVGKVSNIN